MDDDSRPLTAPLTRRGALAGAAGAFGVLVTVRTAGEDLEAAGDRPWVPDDPTKVVGEVARELGQRSPFEAPRRDVRFGGAVSFTPLEALHGSITPSDLHFERHHGGVPSIDPTRHRLVVHGMVERPLSFTLVDIKRFPAVSRICFLECSGNLRVDADERTPPHLVCGLTSQSEWTGVPLGTVLREAGADPRATWLLAEGADAAVMTRSIPRQVWDEAMIVYAQNGEAIRPENGYPLRLLIPGCEGNCSVKWLRRIEVADRPFMTREETSKYTEPLDSGVSRQFSLVMDARSIITYPAFPNVVERGWIEIRGIAWSGRGRIARTEVSTDDGKTWVPARLQEPVLPKAHTGFRHLFHWDGRETVILSRAVDETGYVQPARQALLAARGPSAVPYHLNPITGWRLRRGGDVVYRVEGWA